MELEVGRIYEGFKLISKTDVKEISSKAMLFVHEKSGAQLLFLENDDDNKVFSITFKTPPEDSTGLPHILEHSVLCGSRKFPVKEPFVELAKGSLNTFLNAMTFSDKTMYPIASKNDKDFMNLMDVYLDAVFYPNIYKYPEIFMQEGWHYDLEDKGGELVYNGVVYNEMKGAFSSPDEVLFSKSQHSLFPDTTYGKESGGDPEVIPELTLQQFLDFHKKYYHPSNSYIFLYGKMDVIEKLRFINEEYLKNFDKINVDSDILVQESFSSPKEVIVDYSISEDDDEKDKTFMSLNFVIDKSVNPETYLAFEILEHMLLETPAAPLKRALIESGIGKDVLGRYDNSMLQPVLYIAVKNSNESQKEKFKEVVFGTLQRLVKEGIDKKLIEASININEFRLREANYDGYPKGLIYNIKCLDSWLHGENPLMHLEYEAVFSKIKEALTSDYFERLIEKYLLNNNHSSLVVLRPQKGLAEKKDRELKNKLREYKSRLSEEDINKIINDTKKLRERQTSDDSPEDLEKIPLLSLKDIERKAEELPLVEREENGIKVLAHSETTNGIEYVNLYFDSMGVEQDLIPYVGLLSGVLNKLSTEKYSYEELSKLINIHTGGISFAAEAFEKKGNDEDYYAKFIVKSKALVSKMPELFELIGEIIGHTKFDDKKRLKEIIQELKSRMEMIILDRGHVMSSGRVLSYFSPVEKYRELIRGVAFYQFISELEKNFDSLSDNIIENLKKVSKAIFNKTNLIVSVTGSDDYYEKFREGFNSLCNHLGNDEIVPQEYRFEQTPLNEGLMTPGAVQYVAKGFNIKRLGYAFSGDLHVLSSILSLDYLWNKVRVQGGAYGCFGRFKTNGNMVFASYRDPNLSETLKVYDALDEYVRNFNVNDREMTKYIIGTISELDFPLTPSAKGEKATSNYIKGITQEDIQRERDEVLSTNQERIRECAKIISEAMKQNYLCVIGNESKIKENKDVFNNFVSILK
jgi:Zn-dependent M16 (insulinase) family peptidase